MLTVSHTRICICILLYASLSTVAHAQDFEWLTVFGEDHIREDFGNDVAIDESGNLFVVGSTENDPGGNVNGDFDAFLSKFDTNGNLIWTQRLGTEEEDEGLFVVPDGLGNVFIAGTTLGSLGGPVSDDPGLSGSDGFLAKYSSSGDLEWVRQLDRYGGQGLSSDGQGNAIVEGGSRKTQKYDANGNLVWTNTDTGGLTSMDGLGNIYVGGSTLRRIDSNGQTVWTAVLGDGQHSGFQIATNAQISDQLGNIFIAGRTTGSLGGPYAGFHDAFVSKFDSDGNEIWTRQIGTPDYDEWLGASVDGLGNVYVVGETSGDLGSGDNPIDLIVGKYDADGNLDWLSQFTREQMTSGGFEAGRGVAADKFGKVYVTGYVLNSLGFASDYDAFLAKLAPLVMTVGSQSGGELTISAGEHVTVGDQLIVGRHLGAHGTVTIESGDLSTGTDPLSVSGAVEIGSSGFGVFNQSNGNTYVAGNLVLGKESTGIGTLQLTGGDIDLGGALEVGLEGTGQLTILNGRILNASVVSIGDLPGANGIANVDGENSYLQTPGRITVGNYASGFLRVSNGADVASQSARFGVRPLSEAEVTLEQGLARWIISENLEVGIRGSATLNLDSDSGMSVAGEIVLGRDAGGDGAVELKRGTFSNGTGIASTAPNLTVGQSGSGIFVQTGGRAIVGEQLYVGRRAGGTGEVTVDGVGTRLQTGSSFLIGDAGTGSMTVSNGAVVESLTTAFRLGNTGTDSSGTLTLTENSQIITNNHDIQIGHEGTGILNIADTAQLGAAKHLVLGNAPGSDGTVNQSGGTINVGTVTAGDLTVGWGGTGTYTMTGGTLTTTRQLYLGRAAGAPGTADVGGNDTRVEIGRSAYIGHTGHGLLNITNGAHFETQGVEPNGVQVAREPNSTGEMNISGIGTTMHSSGHWYVGYQGTLGTANISDGAVATTDSFVRVGLSEPGTGVLTIDGAGSMLAASDDVIVGDFGTGTLNMTGGSQLTTTQNLVLGERGENSNGNATISDNSSVSTTVSTIIGKVGTGLLTVEDTAQITVGGGLEIGQQSTGVGTYTQTGGNVNVTGDMRVSVSVGSAGSATISGGTLAAANLFVKPFNTDTTATGSVAISGDADVALTGDITVNNSGTLSVADTANVQASGDLDIGSASVDITGGSLDVQNINFTDSSSSLTLSGGSLATQDIAGDSGFLTFTGGELNAARIGVGGPVDLNQNGGTLIVGGADEVGTLDMIGNHMQFAGSLEIDLGTDGAADKVTNDQHEIHLSGGSMDVNLLDGYMPQLGDTFEIMETTIVAPVVYDVISIGNGYSFNFPDLGALQFETLIETTASGGVNRSILSLTIVSTLDGDFDADGDVDGGDFLAWQRYPSIGDLGDWQVNYGQALPPIAATSQAVPELSSLSLSLMALVVVLVTRTAHDLTSTRSSKFVAY